ncbi:TPA: restriction endonuclease subunit S [Vibrio parahaemolyticus]|uniref:restriction endonuclease subunit S n=1 Tax=Vibrio parahaemolyticus TaxID=670 RepID=UPI00193D3CC8|nr:restriction endonuclease subunit S [Vibrio parahaemolyticus]MBE4292558.1 restriction endonuclease subunit S [Vibrio parahaemolyticus]MBM4985300.1 restriction endonuclease subunit S [Vibrio parahaemolyticus]HCE2390008.1 restriction endonuclease subunit S [Vibrio parahaemolyticus]HCE2670989.1 restriction endonuclease subunit S [Vibrio parahaemolyticus]HCE4615558.1 restriction endonuclease subunit S [Vibrio parahaemolyticus]
MSKYQAYPEYKDSVVEWVGDIPVEWEMWKLSHAYREIGSGTTPPTTSDEWFGGDIPWVTTGELRETVINGTKKNVSEKTIDTFSALRVYPAGSIAMAMYGATIGRLGIFGVDATTNQACCVMTASDVIDNKYLFYWLWAFRQDIINLSSGGGQPNINQEKVASLKISAPIIDEQTQIANFLDHETAKIDTLIEKQQQLIKLLKEKRQAVISHAVTKGLNPLAPMKDSGVEWLGEVPEHWGVSSLGYYASLNTGATPDRSNSSYWEGDVPWIKTGEVKYETIYKTEESISKLAVKQTSVQLSPPGTLLMAMYGQGVTRGRVAILGVHATYNQACVAITPNSHLFNEYLKVFFIAGYHAIRDGGNETSQMNLNADIVRKFKVTVPPINEQKEIVSFLEAELPRFDALLVNADKAIKLMQERRTALISAAVTGKIDVRNWQAPISQDQALEQTA